MIPHTNTPDGSTILLTVTLKLLFLDLADDLKPHAVTQLQRSCKQIVIITKPSVRVRNIF